MMKILYVITKSTWGGAQNYVYDLATSLPKEQFEVAVAAGGSGVLFEKLGSAGIRTYRVSGFERDVNILGEVRAALSLLTIYRKEKPDIIHLNSSKAGVLGGLAAFFYKLLKLSALGGSLPAGQAGASGGKTIFTVHGWGFLEDRTWPAKLAIFLISWFSALLQNRIILISRNDFSLAQRFISRRKLSLIPLGIHPIDFLSREQARGFFEHHTGHSINPDHLLVGVTAELTRNKGLPYVIQAIKEMDRARNPRIRVIIMGEGEDKDHLLQRIESANLQQNVLLAGFIPDAKKYLRAFDIFALPSIKEGLPYVIMEAMAAGLPVLASHVGGIPDLVAHNRHGLLVKPKDTMALQDGLEILSRNPALRERFGKNGMQKASVEFRIDGMIERTANLYTSLM